MHHLKPSSTLQGGKYRIDAIIGEGGFGNTYVATNTGFDETVAIKEFFMKGVSERDETTQSVSVSNGSNYESFRQQKEKFKKEARRLRQFDNPHIVRVHDMFEENGTAYYVMDFIDGENMSERMKRTGKPLAESEVRRLLPQILDALKSVHEAGLWHLDLKPGNIMVDKQGNVKLIDFGASKQLDVQTGGASALTRQTYTTGYAPREQMEENFSKYGPWTDLYALGATLYALLTKKHPPKPSDIDDDMSSDKHDALPMSSSISADMRRLVLWMMNTNRAKRPQSVDEVRNSALLNGGTTSRSNRHVSDETVYAQEDSDEETVLNASRASSYHSSNPNASNTRPASSNFKPSEAPSYQRSSNNNDNSGSSAFIWLALIVVGIIVVVFLANQNNDSEVVEPATVESKTYNTDSNIENNNQNTQEQPSISKSSESYQESPSAPENTNLERGYIKQEGGYTNIRETPNGEIAMKIQDGTSILYSRNSSSWYVVYNTSGQRLGYVHSSKIVSENSRSTVSTDLGNGYIKQEGGYTNIRVAPNGEIAMKIQDGSPILYKRTSSSWWVVYDTSGDRLGYVHSSKIVAR